MFERKKYKEFALIQLKKRWSVPVLMALFTTIVLSIFQMPTIFNGLRNLDWNAISYMDADSISDAINGVMYSPTRTGFTFLESLIEFIFGMAMINVFIKMSHSPNPVKFSDFIESFSLWLKAILIGLWQSLWIFLWSLLFIIPGIVKKYSYSQMYYLSCEYPDVSITKLMDLSKIITRGHKWDLFVLDLSFIGWYLLSSMFTLSIGNLWITPYHEMTKINAYHALMKEAIEKKLITREDVLKSESEDKQ